MKLLCIGDVHLGRRPARLPDALDARALGPPGAWQAAVDHALREQVHAVLLAGDVVDREDDLYEAYADLATGVRRLVEAGIRVLAVAGNHDVQVLPRLADATPELALLGRHGAWESVLLRDGPAEVAVLGWSFPRARVRTSPLESLPRERQPVVTLGLLHCDRDQAASDYAPVSGRALLEAPVDGWLLGHIHAPDALEAPRPVGYLGSLTGLDPGEAGPRGPWCVEVGPGGIERVEHVALAPLRWEELTVDVSGIEDAGAVHALILNAIRALAARRAAEPWAPQALGIRLRLTGRTGLRAQLEGALRDTDPRSRMREEHGIQCFVHEWHLDVRPGIDLEQLAAGQDPAALLARQLLALRGADPAARQALVDQARNEMRALDRRSFDLLRDADLGEAAVAARLEAAGLRALDALLAQREDAE